MSPSIYDKTVYQYIFYRRGNWLRIMCKIIGHKMVRAIEEMPLYHARCSICRYEIEAEQAGQ